MPSPAVSILIPTLNGERELERLLPALRAQRYGGDVELRAIDSSSTDRTVAMLEDAGFTVEVIPRGEFGHGKTRNALAASARGEVLVFLSQDAVPVDGEFLARLVKRLEDPEVAGAVARVVAGPRECALTERTVNDAPEASPESWLHRLGGASFSSLTGAERAEIMRFNNVASCVRADVRAQHPIPDVPFGEDCAWAARVLAEGWALASEPSAVVEHAHSYGPVSAYRRYRSDAAFHRAFHGHIVRGSVWSALRGVLFELKSDLCFAFGTRFEIRSLLRAPALRVGQVLGQFVGSRRTASEWAGGSGPGAPRPFTLDLGGARSDSAPAGGAAEAPPKHLLRQDPSNQVLAASNPHEAGTHEH